MATTDTESSDNEVIYDLTSEARARSAMSQGRPASRSIAVQTDTMPHKKSCTKIHQHRRQKSADNTIKEVRILEHETVRKAQSNPNMLTIETIWTGSKYHHPSLGDYMDPQDCKRDIPPALPERPKSVMKMKIPVPKQAEVVNSKKSPTPTEVPHPKGVFKPCLNINQRRVVKYNLLLSIAINFLVMALGGTGFISIVSGEHNENELRYKYVLIAASFSVCYALLSVTTDALGMLALQLRSRELLLPWLIWYILDMAIYMSVMVLVITFLDNYLILLVIFKIVWTLFVWVNIRDLYTSGKIYGGHHHVRRKLRSDILY